MTASVAIALEARPLERIRSDLAVAGLFVGDRPLRGGAARLDWRLCGLLSDLVLSERLSGAAGEAVLVPSPGALRSPRALVVGLGEREGFRLAAAQQAMADAMARCFALTVSHVALAPLGIASDDLPRHAAAVVGGLLEAARDVEGEFDLSLALPGPQHEAAAAALERAIEAVEPAPFTLRREEPLPLRPGPPRRGEHPQPV